MVQKTKTLLEIDLKKILRKTAKKYALKLPDKVVMVDYGDDVGDLFIKFRHVGIKEGEPTRDGKAIIHYGEDGEIAALEIRSIATLQDTK
ncbi:MAG: hypothetical protein HY619_02120 [Thaumarchaeota archaeon]|nr:hypothetical protein [Nitrososphaerota archaeon]